MHNIAMNEIILTLNALIKNYKKINFVVSENSVSTGVFSVHKEGAKKYSFGIVNDRFALQEIGQRKAEQFYSLAKSRCSIIR